MAIALVVARAIVDTIGTEAVPVLLVCYSTFRPTYEALGGGSFSDFTSRVVGSWGAIFIADTMLDGNTTGDFISPNGGN